MDDLYSDLENYNDINTIEDLRKENAELKFKLDEHKSTVDKLQKDIDKLSSEFKTLEVNYSSLLKTAKAEIERKTQIINNLNSEKDMLVLNSLQNTSKSLLNIQCNMAKDKSNTRWKEIARADLDSSKGKNVKEVPEMKMFETEKDRGIENRMPSTDTASSGNSDDKRLLGVESRPDTYTEKTTDNKEVSKTRNPPPGVRSRRKSMSTFSKMYAKFSTDEEFEELYSVEENYAKEWPLKEDKNRKVSEKNYDKQSHKVSETSGIDDKYSSYHESSRETYYKGKPRYSERYRSNRDKYESTQRSRRHYSPERNHRPPRDHSDDRYQRIDFGRHRILESPPPERNREYDSRRNRDRRSNYERENLYDDRHKISERQGLKHKAQIDYEEPTSKRTRTNSRGRPSKEDIRWPKVQEVAEQRLVPIHLPHNMSCMSPDYIHPEIFPAQPIREIRNTASTKLQDPRLTSKRYIVKRDDNTTSLCSVIGRNVEIVPVDEALWKIEKVPDALQRPPSPTATCAAQLVKNVRMDIDNPVSNLSMESGEIQSGSNTPIGEVVTESLFNDYENTRPMNVLRETKSPLNQTTPVNAVQSTKYKIPKVKMVQEETITQSIAKNTNPVEMLMSNLKSKCEVTTHTEETIDIRKPTKEKKEAPKFAKATSTIEYKSEENIPKERIKLCISLSKLKCQQPQSAREIVAGDLELSDETCDDAELQNDSLTLKDKMQLDISQKKLECGFHMSDNKSQKVQDSSNTTVTKCAPYVNTKEVSPESSKKQKTKRRSQKQKCSSSREISEQICTTQVDKKVKKKSKDSKPPTTQNRTAKFSELFGDSSSLITPEDLGLTPVHAAPEKYMPIFEDAQDAVDVNVEEICKAQEASKPVETNEEQIEPHNITEITSELDKSGSEPRQKIKKLDEIKPDSTVEASTGEISLHDTIKDKSVTSGEVPSAPFQTEVSLKSIVSEAPTLENLVPETVAKDVDVVKTVIISTGVQSQTATNDMELPIRNKLEEFIEDIQKKDVAKTQNMRIHALATSTPYKEIPMLCSHTESDLRPESSNSEDNRLGKNEASLDDQSSVFNLEAQETDAPDIRIFVRRRKFKK